MRHPTVPGTAAGFRATRHPTTANERARSALRSRELTCESRTGNQVTGRMSKIFSRLSASRRRPDRLPAGAHLTDMTGIGRPAGGKK
jgi:hypothetical protein